VYEVVESVRFTSELAGLADPVGRISDMLDGLMFVLARTPEAHPSVPGTNYRVAVSQMGDPHLRVYYTVAASGVSLESTDLI